MPDEPTPRERAEAILTSFKSTLIENWPNTALYGSILNATISAIEAAVTAERARWQAEIHLLCPEEQCRGGMLYYSDGKVAGACEWKGHVIGGYT